MRIDSHGRRAAPSGRRGPGDGAVGKRALGDEVCRDRVVDVRRADAAARVGNFDVLQFDPVIGQGVDDGRRRVPAADCHAQGRGAARAGAAADAVKSR